MASGIYKITNPNGRIYIGQSINILNRFKTYRSGDSKTKQQVKLYRSFQKHGVESHKFDILEYCVIDNLNERERYWQDVYDVLNGGLNCYLTETSEKRRLMDDETRKRISISRTGIGHTEEAKIKIGNAARGNKYQLGRKRKDWEKDKISQTMKEKGINKGNKNPMHGKLGNGARIVFNTLTGIFYDSLKEACKAIEMDYGKGRKYLSGYRKNKSPLVYT